MVGLVAPAAIHHDDQVAVVADHLVAVDALVHDRAATLVARGHVGFGLLLCHSSTLRWIDKDYSHKRRLSGKHPKSGTSAAYYNTVGGGALSFLSIDRSAKLL